MNGRMLAPAVVLAVALAAVPLPFSQEGKVDIGPGESWTYPMDLPSSARVTYIVSSPSPIDVLLVDQRPASNGSPAGAVLPGSQDQVTTAHRTDRLSPGAYQLVLRNDAPANVSVDYQVHLDYEVVGELTAKNLMALSLALAVVIVAVLLYRPRRHFR